MQLVTLPAGSRGVDCNFPLTAALARSVKDAGFDFVMRYIAREKSVATDLSRVEIQMCQDAGLLVGVVQHVKSAQSWGPSATAGKLYGQTAQRLLEVLKLYDGTPIWCDLEGVDPTVDSRFADEYCRAWYEEIVSADPGLYVGWHCGLSPQQLYVLPFKRYWGAYNLNRDEEPAVRGLQLKQHEAPSFPPILGLKFGSYDVNTIQADHKGDLPVFLGA